MAGQGKNRFNMKTQNEGIQKNDLSVLLYQGPCLEQIEDVSIQGK